jgi:hypothetical protein
MTDRPNAQELLDAARMHLEQNIVPVVRTDPRLYFQTLVAINVLKIVGRELMLGTDHAIAEWAGLNTVEALDLAPPTHPHALTAALDARNQQLAADIRRGDYDTGEKQAMLLQHLKQVTIAQLEIANPKYLQTVFGE